MTTPSAASEPLGPQGLPPAIQSAVTGAQDKKAVDVVVLDLREAGAFTDYFVICSGQNQRQVKAIADSVEEALRRARIKPAHVEGYEHAEWVLLDCFDFIVHVFNRETRLFYALDRLWGSAPRIMLPGRDTRTAPGSAAP
jgi:ribosome-associated protein